MSGYARIGEYDFVNQYTLGQLALCLSLPQSRGLCTKSGKTVVAINGAPKDVPIELLSDRFINLTRDRKDWSMAQAATAAVVAKFIEELNQEGYWKYMAATGCACNLRRNFCWDCFPTSIKETIKIGNELRKKHNLSFPPPEQEMT